MAIEAMDLSQESWSRDPVSKETRSVFLDDLPWEVIPLLDVEEETWMALLGLDLST